MIDIIVDELTNSIINRFSEEVFQTKIVKAEKAELLLLKDWNFDWLKEEKQSQVFKLLTEDGDGNIEGLISLDIRQGFVFVSLVENAPQNIGRNGIYLGVAGNLFAYACQMSLEKGFDGYVSFVAKTELIEHYKKMLGAEILFDKNMVIKENAALSLIKKYYK